MFFFYEMFPKYCGMEKVFNSVVWLLLLLHPFRGVLPNDQGDALYTLKSSVQDPNNVLESWDPTLKDPCTWFHVTCNGANRVTRVDLGNCGLSGKLADARLDQLTTLQYMELYENNLIGTIPDEFGNLTSLVSLDLYGNHLTGPIPGTLGKLEKLKYLRLNNNKLTGNIPMSLTNVNSLEELDLSDNNLSGEVPTNGSFSPFTCLSFDKNPSLHCKP